MIMSKTQVQEVQSCRRSPPMSTEDYWVQCIRQWYPDLQSRTYFFPPIHVNRVPYEKLEVAGEVVLVRHATEEESERTTTSSICRPRSHPVGECSTTNLKKRKSESDLSKEPPAHEMWIRTDPDVLRQVGDSDVRGDTAQDRILSGLRKMSNEYESKDGMMVISQLNIGQFFRKNSSAVLPSLLKEFQGLPQKYRQGDVDVLIIHKKYGLISGEIKSIGASPSQQPNEVFRNSVKKKVRDSIQQLEKADMFLKLLISDISDASIKHALMLPYMASFVLQDIIERDSQFAKELQDCLCVSDTRKALEVILCLDQVEEPVSENMKDWFDQFAAMTSTANFSSDLFERIVARFCGPEIAVQIHSVTNEPLELRTEGDGVSEAGKILSRLVLTPQQINILRLSPCQMFLEGPPGTGKTVVLTLQGLNWLRHGFNVHLVSTWKKSRAAAIVMEHQLKLKHRERSPESSANVFLHIFDFDKKDNIDAAVFALTNAVTYGSKLCILVETAGPDGLSFETFCDKLIRSNPEVYLWCTAAQKHMRPKCLQEFTMTELLRIPAPVRPEVDKAVEIQDGLVTCYTSNQSVSETQGPPIKKIIHTVGKDCHSQSIYPEECDKCGHEVARFLMELNVREKGTPLQFRDVMVLCNKPAKLETDSKRETTSNLISGLSAKGFPVSVLTPAQQQSLTQDNRNSEIGHYIRNLVLGFTNQVMITHSDCVWGLKRKIVIIANYGTGHNALIDPARCSSQLVLIQSMDKNTISSS